MANQPPRDPAAAAEFIIASVRVSRPDVLAAKEFLSGVRGGSVAEIAEAWVKKVGRAVPAEAPLYETDPPGTSL